MKTISLLFLLLLTLSCTKDSATNQPLLEKVKMTASTGTWTVTSYVNSGSDETTNFSGYAFTFGATGVFTAVKAPTTVTGTWSVTDTNTSDDTLDDLHFLIAFSAPPTFAELTEDWQILENTSTRIKLTHVSGGGGGTDFLTFEKN